MPKNYIGPFLGLALISISGATATAQQKATEPATVTGDKAAVYDVVSIKPNKSGSDWDTVRMHPNGFTATHINMLSLIQQAFGVKEHQISGAPSWLNSERYDVETKMDSSVADELRKLNKDQRRLEGQRMLQALLAAASS